MYTLSRSYNTGFIIAEPGTLVTFLRIKLLPLKHCVILKYDIFISISCVTFDPMKKSLGVKIEFLLITKIPHSFLRKLLYICFAII